MKTYILIILQVLIHELILSQVSEIKVDSIYILNLTFKNENSFRVIEKELSKNEIIDDTLFLSVNHVFKDGKNNSNKVYLYIIGGENYNSYIKSFRFKGYFYIHNICILVQDSELIDQLKLFDCNNSVGRYFSFTYQSDYMPPLVIGSDIEFVYKINIKKNNNLVFKRNYLTN